MNHLSNLDKPAPTGQSSLPKPTACATERHTLVRKFGRSGTTSAQPRTAAYIHALGVLFTVALALVALMSVCGASWGLSSSCCGGSDPPTTSTKTHQTKLADTTAPVLTGPGKVKPGERVKIELAGESTPDRSVNWTPPPGATNFTFPPDQQPAPGGPPFFFVNVGAGQSLNVEYDAPSCETTLADTVETMYADGSKDAASMETQVTNSASSVASGASVPALSVMPLQATTPVTMWQVTKWIDINGITLTTNLCNDIHSAMTSDKFFIASRMPLGNDVITASYALPFAMGATHTQTMSGNYSQTVYLEDYSSWPSTNILTYTVEYRPEWANFAVNNLPSAGGEHWVTWGLTPTGNITCTSGLTVAQNKWGIVAQLLLDLHDQPDACEGCEVRTYYCYAGQDPPIVFQSQQAARALSVARVAKFVGAASYQGQDITCMDAGPLQLGGSSGLHLGWTEGAWITPTQQITLSEHLENRGAVPLTVTLAWTSSLKSLWRMYGGTWDDPDLGAPITAGTEIALGTSWPDRFQALWLINDVHTDTAAGQHSLVLTATSVTTPSLYVWDNVPLWAGEWVAPGANKQYIYLPLVLRNWP